MANLIFDVDGTLVDSYPSIVERIDTTLKHYNIIYTYEDIYKELIKTSSYDFVRKVIKEYSLNEEEVSSTYDSSESNLDIITLLPDVKETLFELKKRGHKLFIYTHRGKTLNFILKKLEIIDVFIDIVDSTKGLKRKPDGEGNLYIIEKYKLNKNNTYYVGDRDIDILSANNANIKSIFFNSSGIPVTSSYTYKIDKFNELLKLDSEGLL